MLCCVETILFSDKVKKINQNQWSQDRLLVITPDKIFNIHKLNIKRQMNISELGGISKLTEKKKNEFTIHFPSDYDYRYITDK